METLDKKKKLEVKFLKKVPIHPHDRMVRKTKELNDIKVKISSDDLKITKVTLKNLRDRIAKNQN